MYNPDKQGRGTLGSAHRVVCAVLQTGAEEEEVGGGKEELLLLTRSCCISKHQHPLQSIATTLHTHTTHTRGCYCNSSVKLPPCPPPPLDKTLTTVWWKVLMAFLHNRAAESHEILSECSHQ